ncbi:MAG: phosphatidate cytidylyltransferase [Candidatus Omnitrophota bacterium]
MVVKRTLSSIILIVGTVMILIIDWLCGLVATAVIIIGLYEFFGMLENKGVRIYKYFGIGMGAVIPLSIAVRFEPTKTWELFFIVVALLFLIIMQLKRRQHSGTIVDISTTVFGILYVAWFGSFFVKIRYLPNGVWLLAALIIITKLGDIGAFLVGSRFGHTPLIPRISPNKSVEGAIGGLAFSAAAAVALKVFLPFSYGHLIFLGVFLGALGQLGDLSESLMKRDCKIKDSSNIIPGIGGVLDLIDSLLFTAPVFYFYLSITLP